MDRESENNYYQIGEVANICNIPIRTLHYYDEIGLIKPVRINQNSKYRYYSPEQIPTILLIKSYKTAGFSLKQIEKLISSNNIDFIHSMAKSQCAVIEQKILELNLVKERLLLLDYQKNQIKKSDINIQLKRFPSIYVAYKRYRSPCTKENFYNRFAELCKMIEIEKLHIVGTMMVIYYETYENPNYENMDFEVCVRVAEQKELEGVIRKLEDFHVVSAFHYGSYKDIPKTCQQMFDWMSKNNYIPYGPYIENYIIDISTTKNEDNYITELIRPVRKET